MRLRFVLLRSAAVRVQLRHCASLVYAFDGQPRDRVFQAPTEGHKWTGWGRGSSQKGDLCFADVLRIGVVSPVRGMERSAVHAACTFEHLKERAVSERHQCTRLSGSYIHNVCATRVVRTRGTARSYTVGSAANDTVRDMRLRVKFDFENTDKLILRST